MNDQHNCARRSGQTSNPSANETVVSIVHHPKEETQKKDKLTTIIAPEASLGEYEIIGSYQSRDHRDEKQWLEQLLTPWGIGSILILLLANILLNWAQWSKEKNLANTTTESNLTHQKISPSKPSKLIAQNSENLTLDRLSILSLPRHKTSNINSAMATPKVTPKPITGVPTVVAPKTNSNLANALLPPSLQPQIVQNYIQPVNPSPSVSQPESVKQETLSVPQSVSVQQVPQPTSQAQPVSPPINNTDKKTQLDQERIREQIRIREQQSSPLGFNHRTRAKLRAAENQQASSELINQLQQLQQQKVEQSNTTDSTATTQPAQ